MKTKPISFAFYNPYTNTIPNTKKVNPLQTSSFNHMNFSRKLNTKRPSCCFCSSLPCYFEYKENRLNYSMPNDISQDSAICMDDNFYDCPNFLDESYMSELSIARADSGIDISATKCPHNIIQTNGLTVSQQANFPVTSTMLDMYSVFSSSLTHNDQKIESNVSDILSSENIGDTHAQSDLYNFKSSTLCKKKIPYCINKQYSSNVTRFLKSCKNAQCMQSSFFLNRKTATPKRYIKWRKAKSCIAIHKIISPDKFKFKKMHSYPNLLGQYDSELNDSFLYNTPTPTVKSRSFLNTSKLTSSILSKFSHFNFSPMFKEYVLINPRNEISENQQKQKYTPLPSPLPVPAKVAKLSNCEQGSRNIFSSHGKCLHHSLKLNTSQGDSMSLEKQEEKPLTLVPLFL